MRAEGVTRRSKKTGKNFWAGLAMRRLIKSSCRARSTPFYIIRCERRASQVQLIHLLEEVRFLTGASSSVVFALRAQWTTCVIWAQRAKRANAACMCDLAPPISGPRSRRQDAFLKTGPPCRVCPCLPRPDQLSQWARGVHTTGNVPGD